eukprot:jgi/Ulvmu1/2313/UM013_0161.1
MQVIVKYAEIVLTPERPEYEGGPWLIKGMENKAINASCIAYLAADNITESRLHFRSMVLEPDYKQNDEEGVEQVYSMEDFCALNDPLGSALCKSGHALCWRNALQDRVTPFKLADPTRPGVRKIAAVFIVHPDRRVLSTRDVPPQQPEWHDTESRLDSTMPPDVKLQLDAFMEFPVLLEGAKVLRAELMKERSRVEVNVSEAGYERKIYLCDH